MKRPLGIFLLLFILLLNGHSFHADTFKGHDNYIPIKTSGLVNSGSFGNAPYKAAGTIIPVRSLFKKEYRKLRGTNEEDDEDEKSLSQKKNENLLRYKVVQSFILAFLPQSSGSPNNYIKHCRSFFRHSSSESSSHCYILYQVFRI